MSNIIRRLESSMHALIPGLIVAGLVSVTAIAIETGERAALGQPIVEALVAAILLGWSSVILW